VSFMQMHPVTFIEFLLASGHRAIVDEILRHRSDQAMIAPIHQKILALLGEYMLIGGMPEVVAHWTKYRDIQVVKDLQRYLIMAYQQDFEKYAKKHQQKYLRLLFEQIPTLITQAFKFTHIAGNYQKRELSPCLDLLCKAGVVHKVICSSSHRIPLAAEAQNETYKLIMLDIALTQSMLGFDPKDWLLKPEVPLANQGALCEAFIGQEILAYSAMTQQSLQLHYWHRDKRGSQAEVDYVIARGQGIYPIEIKSGRGSTLKSLHMFLQQTPLAPYGIRFSIQPYSVHEKIYSYPLYAVAGALSHLGDVFELND